MNKTVADILIFGAAGLMVAALPAILIAGAYCVWVSGGSVTNVELGTILEYAPWNSGRNEPFQTGALAGLGFWLAGGIAAAVIGYRPTLTSHGSAKWASMQDLKRADLVAPLKDVQGPVFAKFGKPKSKGPFLTSTEIPHSLIAAPTGSGKGVGIVIPTLLTYNGSVVCLDVKGENFELTSRRRAEMGDKIFKFSPYDPEGRSHRYNPVDIVAEADERRRFTEARRLASSLIVAKSKSAEGFLEGAREIFAATVVYAIECKTPTIAAVYDLISQQGEAHKNFENMAEAAKAPESKSIFNRMASTDIRTLSAYLSVLSDGGLSLWADPAVRDATSASDFSFVPLRSVPATIYIVVSPNDLDPLSALIRLMFQQAVAVTQRAMPGPDEKFPVLFLLDEFASLGRMDTLGTAITTLRGYGGRLMIVVQSLSNLGIYGKEGAANFLANCRLQLFMAPADSETPDYISKAVGDFTRKARSKSWQSNDFTSSNYQEREEGARLIRPEELRKLGENTVVALIQNQDPIKTDKVRYYEDAGLKALFEAQSGPFPEAPSLYDESDAGEERAQTSESSETEMPEGQGAAPATNDDVPENLGTEEVAKAQSETLSAIARARAAARAMENGEALPKDLEKEAVADLDAHLGKHGSTKDAIAAARRALNDSTAL